VDEFDVGEALRHKTIFIFPVWILLAFADARSAFAKSTFPMAPRLKPVLESAIPLSVGVPRKIDQEKLTISDTYIFTDKKVSEVPVWARDEAGLVYAGTIAIGGSFEPEAIFNRYGRMYYGTSKIDSVKLQPWLAQQRTLDKNRVITVYVDGGYVKRIE
jgi:hypothetical protein